MRVSREHAARVRLPKSSPHIVGDDGGVAVVDGPAILEDWLERLYYSSIIGIST
jgi:hypothetical protein